MKPFYLLLLTTLIVKSQSYIQTTNTTSTIDSNLQHNGSLILGDLFTNSPFYKLQLYSNDLENLSFTMGNIKGHMQYSIAACNGCFSRWAIPGDIIFRRRGENRNTLFYFDSSVNNGEFSYSFLNKDDQLMRIHDNGKIVIGNNVNWDNENYLLYVQDGI